MLLILFVVSWVWQRLQIQRFNFLSGPGSAAQKLQTGFDAGIVGKALDGDALSHFIPAVLLYQLIQDHFKRNSVGGIIGLWICHLVLASFQRSSL